jgi:hypothetical protein
MTLRSIILAVAFLCAPLSLLVIAFPITWGYGGYLEGPVGNNVAVFYWVDPSGPAARAGIRVGDHALMPRGVEDIQQLSGNVGTVAHIPMLDKNGAVHVVNFAFVPFSGALAVQQQFNKLLSALTALGAFIVAILVVLRARDRRAGERAALVLLLAGAGAFCQSAALVCGNAWIGTLFYWESPAFFSGATIWAALRLLAIYPPTPSRLRTLLGHVGIIALLFGLFASGTRASGDWTGHNLFLFGVGWFALAELLLIAMLAVAIIDGIVTSGNAYATPMRWLGGMWLIALAFNAVPLIATFANIPTSHYLDFAGAGTVFFLAFGVAYPVLRHRLIDLNILVSRASVFGIASAIIVGAFVVAEWIIGRIFERSIGFSPQREGLAAEVLTLVVVLVLGISARSIHAFVEDRMTKTFFRKRMKGLAEIQRVAREADAATDPRAIMEIAVSTAQRCLEPLGTALYLRSGNRYDRVAAAGALAMPDAYAFNDEPALRLRRWQEPFELDDDSEDRHHILFVPMTLRGDILGFLCCGPKPDRTAYLPDEVAALSLLAHHVGIASALLARAPMIPAIALAPT